jgi:methylenetetrahydrofolate reductase (NADPH)
MARISDLLARGRTFSFEFFPPRDDAMQLTLGRTIAELEPLEPSFVSVTYGAGGSSRERTRNIVTWVARETAITPMAHLTCQGHSRAEITELLDDYHAAGVENIMALGGDLPAEMAASASRDYRYACDLVADVAATGHFSIGVAAHPEVHPASPDRATDRRHLADKLAAADFAVTQFFFEAHHYFELVEELSDLGVTKPVLPGIMPVTNVAQITRMATLSGAEVPSWLVEAVTGFDDPADVRRVGVELASRMCAELLDGGAPGLHFYTMNRSTASREIYSNLGLGVS